MRGGEGLKSVRVWGEGGAESGRCVSEGVGEGGVESEGVGEGGVESEGVGEGELQLQTLGPLPPPQVGNSKRLNHLKLQKLLREMSLKERRTKKTQEVRPRQLLQSTSLLCTYSRVHFSFSSSSCVCTYFTTAPVLFRLVCWLMDVNRLTLNLTILRKHRNA